MYNSACVQPTALKFESRTSYHCSYMTENFSFIAYSQTKLCVFKVTKSDACIRIRIGSKFMVMFTWFLGLLNI